MLMREFVDLNCDMGEGFGQWVLGEAPDEEIMALISSIWPWYHSTSGLS